MKELSTFKLKKQFIFTTVNKSQELTPSVVQKSLDIAYEQLSILYENQALRQLNIKIASPKFLYWQKLERWDGSAIRITTEVSSKDSDSKSLENFVSAIKTLPPKYRYRPIDWELEAELVNIEHQEEEEIKYKRND